MDLTVVDNPELLRFEARAGDVVAGFADYQPSPQGLVLPHTEVDPAFEGQGVGSTLVRRMLDELRDRGETVVPRCPFVRSYIRRHWDAYGSMAVGLSEPPADGD
jgi:predicted GNAT family acetyltransferase